MPTGLARWKPLFHKRGLGSWETARSVAILSFKLRTTAAPVGGSCCRRFSHISVVIFTKGLSGAVKCIQCSQKTKNKKTNKKRFGTGGSPLTRESLGRGTPRIGRGFGSGRPPNTGSLGGGKVGTLTGSVGIRCVGLCHCLFVCLPACLSVCSSSIDCAVFVLVSWHFCMCVLLCLRVRFCIRAFLHRVLHWG